MSTSITWFQLRSQSYNKIIGQLRVVESERIIKDENGTDEWEKLWVLIENESIGRLSYHSTEADRIHQLLTKDIECPYGDGVSENDVKQAPFLGDINEEFTLLKGSFGIMNVNKVSKFVAEVTAMNVLARGDFNDFYESLPENVKLEIEEELNEGQTQEDYLFGILSPFTKLHVDSSKTKSWILIHNG